MRILHTADWHIGKLVHNVHMTEDQHYILKQLIELIKKEKPEVLIIAGDIYDRAVPPTEAVELLDETLTEIVMEHGTTVIAVAGNHDSPDRVGFGSRMLRDNGLHISGLMVERIKPVTVEAGEGPVDFWMIPFAEPAILRELHGDDKIRSHDDAMKKILAQVTADMDTTRPNICIAHAYMMGTDTDEVSESVRPLSIGGSEYVDWEPFKVFDYVALGHLHRPQKVKEDKIRYAGSLMKYSFSEAKQKKSVTMLEVDGDGKVDISFHELRPIRDMRIIKGQLNALLHKDVYMETNTEDYIMAILTDEGELLDPMNALRTVYPNVMRVEKEQYGRRVGEEQSSAGHDFKKKSDLELFGEFYENIGGETFDEVRAEVVGDVIDGLLKKGRMA